MSKSIALPCSAPRLRQLPLVLAALLAAGPASADEVTDSEYQNATDLDAVTVLARRSNENAKDLPFSIHVIDREELNDHRALSFEDALRSVPGVDINAWGGFNDSNVLIRGIGSLYQVNAEDSSVTVNVDGVPISSRNGSLATLDIDQVEVLKGPQGTLYGGNSEAGAINVTTKRPTRDTEGYLRGEIGQNGTYLAEGAAGGALTNTLTGRIAVRTDGSHSETENLSDGSPVLKPHQYAYRGSLLWQPVEATNVFFAAEHQRQQDQVGLTVLMPYGDSPKQDLAGSKLRAYNVMDRVSLQVDHDFAAGRLTSLSSFVHGNYFQRNGVDATVARLAYYMDTPYLQDAWAVSRIFNQDLRFQSLPGSDVFWVTGVNVSHSQRSHDNAVPLSGSSNDRDFESKSEAVYSEATFPLGERLKLTTGARYSWEQKQYDGYFSSDYTGQSEDHRALHDNYATGRVGLTYTLNPTTNLYAMQARGHKSGGWNDYTTQIADGDPYKAAKVDSSEIGFKSAGSNGRWMVNGDLFYNHARNEDLMGYDYQTLATTSINGDVRSKGAELEGSWRVLPALSLSGGVTYTKAEIVHAISGVSGGDVAAGNRVPDVPKFSAVATVRYSQPLPLSWGSNQPSINALLTARHVGSREGDVQNHFELEAYTKVDLHLGLILGRFETYLWADNLTNRDYQLYAYQYTAGVIAGMPARGRTVGAGIRYDF